MFGRIFLILLGSVTLTFSTSLVEAASWYTFTPGPTIAMTGSNTQVFFDVADDIGMSGSSVPSPHLDTNTREFDGAFYLSGAGWVDFSTGSYSVSLDCGAQSLSDLTVDCAITGTAYAEIAGDVTFSGAFFHPLSGEITGTLSTFVGDYSLSGVLLPLFPAFFAEGTGSTADNMKTLSISGSTRYFGLGSWSFHFQPLLYADVVYVSLSNIDLSMASAYNVSIYDKNGSMTSFLYTVIATTPSSSITPGTLHEFFCSNHSSDSRCPDGATLSPMTLSKLPSATPVIANGTDTYDFTLKIRDTYGNKVDSGSVFIEYTSSVKNIQVPNAEYGNIADYCFLFDCTTSGSLSTIFSQTYAATLPDLKYSFSSIAPTDASSNMLSLSGIIYNGIDIADSSWKSSLVFTPWYNSSLSVVGDIVINTGVSFSGKISPTPDVFSPNNLSAVYRIDIGNNISSYFTGFTSVSPINCTKYYAGSGLNECNWIDPFGVFISTADTSFTGTYKPQVQTPPTELVSYKSYITYEKGGIRVLYSSASGNLGGAQYGQSPLRILGQSNLGGQYSGIGSKSRSDFWNSLRRDIALLSRNRTSYTDVDYLVETGATLTVTNASFATKRTLITIGQDIVISGDIVKRDHPLAIIALTDSAGNGGNITIDPSVQNISASLFAEHGVSSSGMNQLAILGSLISSNTTGGASASPKICPYFIDISLCDQATAEKYDLEKLRPDFDKNTSPKASLSAALANPGVATIIEYDGRILSDPPPGLGK